MDGQNAVILFFSVFYAISLSSISKFRVFDTGALLRDRGKRWRVFLRILVGLCIANLLPLYGLYLLLTTDCVVPRTVTHPKVIIAAAVTCLAVFAIPRLLHGVFAIWPTVFYRDNLWKDVAHEAKAEPDDHFLAHLIPGLIYAALWPAVAVGWLYWQHIPPTTPTPLAPAEVSASADSAIIGKLSPFEVVVAIVALVNGWYTLYKSFWEGARLDIHPGDSVGFVISQGGGVGKFHLFCSVMNSGVKIGALHRLEVVVHGPGDWNHSFRWNLFFKSTPGGEDRQPDVMPYTVAVPGRDSRPLFTEFTVTPNSVRIVQWPEGDYEFTILGWVNQANRTEAPALRREFHVRLTKDLANTLNTSQPQGPSVVSAPITEWSVS